MEKDRSYKIIAVVALLVAVVGLSIAYAGYTATLTIDGTATVAATNWKIEWADMGTATTTGYATTDGATFAIEESKQAVSGSLGTLNAPGDSISYTWKAKNNGSLNAVITSVSKGGLTCTGGGTGEADAVCAELELSITYAGAEITNAVPSAKELNKADSKDVVLTLTWKADGAAKVTSPVTVTVGTTTFTYEQAA